MQKRSNIQPLNIYAFSYSDNISNQAKRRFKSLLPKISSKSSMKNQQKSFNNYIPNEAPYVVQPLRIFINAIEKHNVKFSKWEINANPIQNFGQSENAVMRILSTNDNTNDEFIEKIIRTYNFEYILSCQRNFLKSFFPKLIHFLNQDLIPIISKPLYDSTMRPNPKFNNVVKHAMLRCSRTIIDTAAFVMIHLFHTYEYSTNMIETKKFIIKNYGNLLVSFECTPNILDRDNVSPESCILGVILETTNISFWNSLTGHRVFEAYDVISPMEKQLKHHIHKVSLFPEAPMLLKYDIPMLKMSISCFFPIQPESSEEYFTSFSKSTRVNSDSTGSSGSIS